MAGLGPTWLYRKEKGAPVQQNEATLAAQPTNGTKFAREITTSNKLYKTNCTRHFAAATSHCFASLNYSAQFKFVAMVLGNRNSCTMLKL